jgi:hypothetical protein
MLSVHFMGDLTAINASNNRQKALYWLLEVDPPGPTAGLHVKHSLVGSLIVAILSRVRLSHNYRDIS